jgi:predicted nuclease of predicted toxin-antitoxin system
VIVLLDTCVWGGAVKDLRSAGHDVVWAGDWQEDPGDEEILTKAHSEGRVLVTLDKDFGELAIVYGRLHSGILRLVNLPARQQGLVAARVLALYGDELRSGAIVTVDARRIRIRPPYREEP